MEAILGSKFNIPHTRIHFIPRAEKNAVPEKQETLQIKEKEKQGQENRPLLIITREKSIMAIQLLSEFVFLNYV